MKERLITNIIERLLIIAGLLIYLAVCFAGGGCEDEPEAISGELAYLHIWDDICEKELIAIYHVEWGYSVHCAICGRVYSNATEVGDRICKRISEPNEASYKAFFGWE